MNDVERGKKLNRLIKLQNKMKRSKTHKKFIAKIDEELDILFKETAERFLDVFGSKHKLVQDLIRQKR